MREIDVRSLIPAVKNLCIEANICLGRDVINRIKKMKDKEESPIAVEVLELLLKNYRLAEENRMPICQDTGVAVIFLELGQDIHLTGGDLTVALNEGVRQGYEAGYLRKSMVEDPVFKRINTNDNTPAMIYTEIVPGDKLKITVAPKGGGSENMSEVKMMKASDGVEGIIDFVVNRISRSGSNPCPPVVVGIGIGGNFEQCALLAKKALLLDLDQENPDPRWAAVEAEILKKINNLGIGPQGLGGRTTALAVKILHKPCHIASLPVAVNVQCHAARHKIVIM